MAFSGDARSCPEFRCTSQVLRSKEPLVFFLNLAFAPRTRDSSICFSLIFAF